MKLLIDFFPIILFFGAFQVWGIFVATAVAMAAQVATIAWLWWRTRKIEPMQWVSLGIILVFGGATILSHDETFIKWKPTVLYWVLGGALLVGMLMRRNLMKVVMGTQMEMPEPAWRVMNWSWIGFFAFMGALNLWVAFHFDTATWVKFKLFGGIGLFALFAVAQAFYLSRFMKEADAPDA
jgi:intracellular septation protein